MIMASTTFSRQVFIPVPEAGQLFASSINKLWKGGVLTDLEFQVEGIPIQCHKVILAASSELFEEQLDKTGTVTFPQGVTYDDAKAIVNFCYTGEFPRDHKIAARLLPCAIQLKIIYLIELISKIISDSMNELNVFELREIARKNDLKCLNKAAYEFLCRDLDMVERNNSDFYKMSVEDLYEILADQKTKMYEYRLMECVLAWLLKDANARMKHASKLLEQVRYVSFDPPYIEKLKSDSRIKSYKVLEDFVNAAASYHDKSFEEKEKIINSNTIFREPEIVKLSQPIEEQ